MADAPEKSTENILRRMLHDDASVASLFPSRALERAIVSASRAQLGATFLVAELTESTPTLAEVTHGVTDSSLVFLLDGAEGAQGIAALSSQLLATVLGLLMTGQIPDAQADPRPPTRVDADILRAFLDQILADFACLLAEQSTASWSQGIVSGAQLPDLRFVKFSLPEVPYRGFDLRLGVAGAGDSMTLRLVFPMETATPPAPSGSAEGAPDSGGGAFAALSGAPVRLQAVLARLQIPMGEVSGWNVGDVLPLAGGAIDGVQLETADGTVAAMGQLGKARGDLAVRINRLGVGEGAPSALPLLNETRAAN